MDIVVKYVVANVLSSVLNAELCGKIVLRSSINFLQIGTKVALNMITTIDGQLNFWPF